jgi:integrase
MSDAQFQLFVRGLSADRKANGEPVRSNRTIVTIARRTLDFLEHVGQQYCILDFIAPDGPHINAVRREFLVKSKHGGNIVKRYWHHDCLPTPSPENRRYMVPEEYVNRLRQAAHTFTKSDFRKRRAQVMLRLFEFTGGRRIEIANLKVADIKAAKEMTEPYLSMLTFKQGGEPETRLVPIRHSELDFILEYVEFYRDPLVEKVFDGKDHGYLLVSERTGTKLTPNTLTLEIFLLRKAARIKGRAHPHLFRHRYITVSLQRLIRAYKIKNKANFAELLSVLEDFKMVVMELTGHKSMESLERYLDWAFALQSTAVDKNDDVVVVSELARAGRASVAELEVMRESMNEAEFARVAMERMRELVADLSAHDVLKKEPGAGSSMLAEAVEPRSA